MRDSFCELNYDQMQEVDGGFAWMPVVKFVAKAAIVGVGTRVGEEIVDRVISSFN